MASSRSVSSMAGWRLSQRSKRDVAKKSVAGMMAGVHCQPTQPDMRPRTMAMIAM